MTGWVLIFATILLVVIACIMAVQENTIWAQLLLVLASGTAGGGVMLLLTKYKK